VLGATATARPQFDAWGPQFGVSGPSRSGFAAGIVARAERLVPLNESSEMITDSIIPCAMNIPVIRRSGLAVKVCHEADGGSAISFGRADRLTG
jgi:hypothetical protein